MDESARSFTSVWCDSKSQERRNTFSLFLSILSLVDVWLSFFLKKEQQVFCCWLREKKEND
jgi:hypothetical protein